MTDPTTGHDIDNNEGEPTMTITDYPTPIPLCPGLEHDTADTDYRHDPWGAGMILLGAVCDVLQILGGEIPDSAGYSPSPLLGAEGFRDPLVHNEETGEGYWEELFADAIREGWTTLEQLSSYAEALSTWLDGVRAAGRDY